MSQQRRDLLRGAAALGLAAVAGPAPAQPAYPAKPLRVVVPNAAGGVADLTMRTVGAALAERLGQPVVIDNRPGAGGVVAGQTLIAAPPDGYTLMVATNANAISTSLFRSLPFDALRDFAPVGTLGFFPIALVVPPGSPYRTIADLLAGLRRDPAAANIGTISVGSTQNLAAELFKSVAGIDATTVPFSGTPQLVTALLRNDVPVAFEILAPLMGQVADGSLRVLAVTSAARAATLPDVPTLREAGLADFDVSSWNALVAPGRTPDAVIATLNREVNATLALPAVRQHLLEAGVEARGGTPAELGRLLAAETEKWRRVIETARIEKQ